METTEKYKGHDFTVTIDRSTMERGYVLHIWDDDRNMIPQNEPLKYFDFCKHYGFDPDWPHEKIE